MEVSNYNSEICAVGKIMAYSMVEAAVAETLLAAHRSVSCLLVLAGYLLEDRSDLTVVNNRFPFEELHKVEKPATENKDASDSENDDEDDDETGEQDDDAGDEDFSGEESGDEDDDEEADPEENPAANGNAGSDDDDDDEDDDEEGEDEDGEDDEEEDDEDEEEDKDQPPAKKRK